MCDEIICKRSLQRGRLRGIRKPHFLCDDKAAGDRLAGVMLGNVGQLTFEGRCVDAGAADGIPCNGIVIAGEGEHGRIVHMLLDLVFEGFDLRGNAIL